MIGEFAENPLISGQGSAEVLVQPEYVDSPLAELREALPDTEKKVIVVLQSGGVLILGDWKNGASAILQMWLAGEGAGGAIADVLSGKVNPCGKLPETFPTKPRDDMNGVTRSLIDTYPERLEVGYRYYDNHPEEIAFAFGHGLSYTNFEYSDLLVSPEESCVKVSMMLKNTGDCEGKEIVQLYTGVCDSCVSRPKKELKAFQKVSLLPEESRKLCFVLSKEDFSYYNPILHTWVAAGGYDRLKCKRGC